KGYSGPRKGHFHPRTDGCAWDEFGRRRPGVDGDGRRDYKPTIFLSSATVSVILVFIPSHLSGPSAMKSVMSVFRSPSLFVAAVLASPVMSLIFSSILGIKASIGLMNSAFPLAIVIAACFLASSAMD